ncbi:trehalose-phosphatase [Plantactinospora sp. GCM10030261]|uniref:trehalose-phosphatase n=1 Tax=Plantactinospora sp. GCM10030261 TaxID=3273420 RepID=UPI003605E94D
MPPLNEGIPRLTRPFTADEAWRATVDRPDQCVMFFDFDGTLAPVRDDPTAVQPAPKVLAAIDALAGQVRRIAIVSARPVDFLREHFAALGHVDLYGLYGLEHCHDGGETVTEEAAVPWIPTMAELADDARTELPEGTLVEYKRLSVALHYRTAPRLAEAVESWAQERAARLRLKVQVGRMVVELKPPVDQDKGLVIGGAIGDAGCAWYFGDDVSDIKAFAALRDREAVDEDFRGICVAVANPETGREVSEAADLTIDSPEALGDFLTEAVHRFAGR